MALFPIAADIQRAESVGAVTASSSATTLTANASPNVKATSYTQLIASTSFAAQWLLIQVGEPNNTARNYLIDIAIGASSSEVNIISNLQVGVGGQTLFGGVQFLFPVSIPAGVRLSARCQCSSGSSTIKVIAVLFGGGFAQAEALSIVDTYGADTSDSGGTSVDPGGTINTKPGYVQITASTNRHHKFLLIAVSNQNNAATTACSWLLDIAIGGAGSEVVIIPNLYMQTTGNSDIVTPQSFCLLPCNIPAGSRISVNMQCSINDATDRLLDITIYGVG